MPKQIQSLERGLFILESIIFARKPVTSSELANRLGVHKSTVSHLTTTLIELGYLEKEPGSAKLFPGRSVFKTSRAVTMNTDVLEIATPQIERLADATGETSHLCELRGHEVLFLINAASKMTLRVETATGTIEPAHSTAVGKALLSGMKTDEIEWLFEGVEMKKFTEKTLTDLPSLIKEVEKVRAAGYAVDNEEQTPGTGCIAVPLKGVYGNVIAAIGISGPASHLFRG